MLNTRIVFLLSIALATVACSPTPTTDTGMQDAAVDMSVAPDSRSDAQQDVPRDLGPPHVPQIFGNCRSNAECLDGDICLLNTEGYPGGFCTRPCTSANSCNTDTNPLGVNGVCRLVGTRMLCQRMCLNGFDCGRDGYTCIKAAGAMSGYCTPSCGETNCGEGAVCNLWTSLCQTPPVALTGRDNGLACSMRGPMSECRSTACILANNTGTFSGWNNGNCVSNCMLPQGWNPGSLWPTEEFPRGNCPTGDICFPNGGGLAEADPGICLHECRTNSDCRVSEGYGCKKTFNRGRTPHTWMNGYCAPLDCLVAGMTCPSGYICETQVRGSGASRTNVGVCRPPVPDAGTPDSGPPDMGVPDVGPPDMGPPDTGTADAGTDTGVTLPDVELPDAGLDVSID